MLTGNPKDLSQEEATDIIQKIRDVMKGPRTAPTSDEEVVIEVLDILDEYKID